MFESKEGQNVPDVTFIMQANNEWLKRSSAEIFNNKTVIVFSLPGAFTPTCSSSHLPRYDELANKLFDNGVDDIYCVSVNDTFVMNAWADAQHTKHIKFLPDGNGDFTREMGLLVNKADLGFGDRSWRYAMLVKNGVIEKMFIEPNLPGDPFEVSDADTMLAYINPEAVQKETILLITKPDCPFCVKAKSHLVSKGLQYEELTLGEAVNLTAMMALANSNTVPQCFVDGKHIGDSEALLNHFS